MVESSCPLATACWRRCRFSTRRREQRFDWKDAHPLRPVLCLRAGTIVSKFLAWDPEERHAFVVATEPSRSVRSQTSYTAGGDPPRYNLCAFPTRGLLA